MQVSSTVCRQHVQLTRRYFLQLGAAGVAGLSTLPLWAADKSESPELAAAIDKLEYLTPHDDFGTVERGNPLPYTLPEDKRREVGLERDTWKLEVIADPESNSQLENPLSIEAGNALDFDSLLKLGETRSVRFLKVMTCNNIAEPLGIGLWEGVPLRDVIWLTRPTENVRRVFYHGYHNDDPKQLFQSSQSIGRVLEDPPGDHPVTLCYKLNGEWLSGKRGGPVRMLVPDAYGFKSVKWLKRVLLTNNHQANDTYARGNNDIDSWMKTFARFVGSPSKVKAGTPVPITGLIQVGISGVSKVQVWLSRKDEALPEDDPDFARAPWQDADILPPPEDWGGDLPDGKLPGDVRNFDADGKPRHWPMRYAIAHWAKLLTDIPPGNYDLRCRTIDANGIAQPLPRPFPKSGRNAIQRSTLIVET